MELGGLGSAAGSPGSSRRALPCPEPSGAAQGGTAVLRPIGRSCGGGDAAAAPNAGTAPGEMEDRTKAVVHNHLRALGLSWCSPGSALAWDPWCLHQKPSPFTVGVCRRQRARGRSWRCFLCGTVVMPCHVFLWPLGKTGFSSARTARLMAGSRLGSCSLRGLRCPSLRHPEQRPLLCCRLLLGLVGLVPGLLAGRHEVMLPAILMLPRKPEFSFLFAVWGAERGGRRPRHTPRARPRELPVEPESSSLLQPFGSCKKTPCFSVCSPIAPCLLPDSISAMFLPRVPAGHGAKWHGCPLLVPKSDVAPPEAFSAVPIARNPLTSWNLVGFF